jgi:phosphoribosylaminoimidazole carboxylase PurE protein
MSRKRGFEQNPVVGVIMGSDSDLEIMQHSAIKLEKFEVPHEVRVISAHRTPDKAVKYGRTAVRRGLQVIIAGAGGSAHLPGKVAPYTRVPVLGVALGNTPKSIEAAIGSIDEMPEGVPVPLAGINKKGAVNAALESIRILALLNPVYAEAYEQFVQEMAEEVEAKDEAIRIKGYKVYLRDQRLTEELKQSG